MRHLASVMIIAAIVAACAADDDTPRAGGTPRLAAASDAAPTPRQETTTGSGGIELYRAADLSRVADELARGGSTGRTVGAHRTYHYVVARRVASGVPEVHDQWIDVTIVQSGHAALLSGGRVDGGREESAGEHRGGTIVGGATHPLAAGDLFVVPAGVPHQFQLSRGDSIRYLTLKVSQPER